MLTDLNPFQRSRTAPTGYEKVRTVFHTIRTVQTISSIIVGSILIFFIHALTLEHYSAPWTFIILTITSFLTILCLTATIIFHCLTGLSPRFNLVLNTTMLALWTIGFGMLTYWAFDTLKSACATKTWRNDDGVMVCQSYKTLFTFALFGFLATIAAVGLDIHINRLATRFGKHTRLDAGDHKPRVVDARGPYADEHGRHSTDEMDNFPSRNSDAFEVPHAGYGAHVDKADKGLLGGDGYAMPEAQFDFDTGYKGGHEDRVFGAAR